MMDILMSEICWEHKWNKIASDIKLVVYSSTIVKVLPIKIYQKLFPGGNECRPVYSDFSTSNDAGRHS